MKVRAFALRNIKELLRDPLSYIFCLGFPIIMLVIMTFVNSSILEEAQMTIFNIDKLAPGICVFSFTFVMLFTCLQVSKDRTGAFLIRLYASPMKPAEYIAGYTFPLIVIALGQSIITFAVSVLICITSDVSLKFANILLSVLTLIPAVFLFMGLGLLIGSIFNEKVAPPVSSIIITLSSIIGGIWMDVEMIGGAVRNIAMAFPFYHAVKASRAALSGNYSDIVAPLLIVILFAAAVYINNYF